FGDPVRTAVPDDLHRGQLRHDHRYELEIAPEFVKLVRSAVDRHRLLDAGAAGSAEPRARVARGSPDQAGAGGREQRTDRMMLPRQFLRAPHDERGAAERGRPALRMLHDRFHYFFSPDPGSAMPRCISAMTSDTRCRLTQLN